MNDNSELLDNPIWYPHFLVSLIFIIIGFIITIVWILIDNTFNWSDLIVGFIICLVSFMALGMGPEVFLRPKYIKICEDGIIIYSRLSNHSEKLNWEKIIKIVTNDKKSIFDSGRDGWIGIGDNGIVKKTLNVYTPTVIRVREAYREKMGQYPSGRSGVE
jgi:hypothetical protein